MWCAQCDGPMYRPMTDCVKLSVNQKLRQPAYDGITQIEEEEWRKRMEMEREGHLLLNGKVDEGNDVV